MQGFAWKFKRSSRASSCSRRKRELTLEVSFGRSVPGIECVAVHPRPTGEGTGERMYDAYTPGDSAHSIEPKFARGRTGDPPSNLLISWPPWLMRPRAGLPS